jgi:hypothetical protein
MDVSFSVRVTILESVHANLASTTRVTAGIDLVNAVCACN